MEIPLALDFHCHLRQDELLEHVCSKLVSGGTQLALAMPNTVPPIRTAEDADNYRDRLIKQEPRVLYLMTLYLTPDLTPDMIREASAHGVTGVKYYPHGLTTNSESGLDASSGFERVYPTLKTMQEVGMVLNIHGEVGSSHEADICVMNAEIHFLKHLEKLHHDLPNLKIVLEHMTTAEAVECVQKLGPNVAATITVHHLELFVDDWAGSPHHFCKPVAKYPRDRKALREAVLSGNPKFFLGTDSAPHYRDRKEGPSCCAGVYTSEHMLCTLATILESFGAVDKLTDFSFEHGRAFYADQIEMAKTAQTRRLQELGIEENLLLSSGEKGRMCTLVKEDQVIVPSVVAKTGKEVVPFKCGQSVHYTLQF